MPCPLVYEGRRNGFQEIFSSDTTDEIVELNIAIVSSFIHKVAFEGIRKKCFIDWLVTIIDILLLLVSSAEGRFAIVQYFYIQYKLW